MPESANKPDYPERVTACLLGGAIGDAFGYAIEFKSLAEIREKFGKEGLTNPLLKDDKLIVSDDTQMTLFTLEALLLADLSDATGLLEAIRLAYLDWNYTQRHRPLNWPITGHIAREPILHHDRAPGMTCLSALTQGGTGSPEEKINDSKGCGGVMRVAPIGLVRRWSPEQAFDIAMRAAAMTHGHPSGYLSAGVMAAILRLLVDGHDLVAATEQSLGILERHDDHEETLAAMRDALRMAQNPAPHPLGDLTMLGEGWVGEEALAIALYAALRAESFRDCFIIAANHDGDSDSTASIAGQLYGASHGCVGLPSQWAQNLDIAPILDDLTTRFLTMHDR